MNAISALSILCTCSPIDVAASTGHLTARMADEILREACDQVGINGASTHSFRQSAITNLHKQDYVLREIVQISGNRDITNVSHYIGVICREKIVHFSF